MLPISYWTNNIEFVCAKPMPVQGGISRRRRACLGVVLPASLGLKTVFPVGTLGHEWVPERTPEGAERSGALGAKRRVVRTGSRVTIVPTVGGLASM
jgi:hypothetical protein